MSNCILLENVTIEYQLYDSYFKQGIDYLLGNIPSKLGVIKPLKKIALQEINLKVQPGERIGIIGSNGAGKTTLLKTIIGSLLPNKGKATRRGKILPLMTTGLGFHPELTGLENIKISLRLSGVPKSEQKKIIEEIIEFVELGEYLHQPIRTYSLGMMARLAFAASTATSPDILIIDEVLGAGDTYFNNKCNLRIKKLSENGTTLLIVSHSMDQILAFSERVIWMQEGSIIKDGLPQEVVRAYDSFMSQKISHNIQIQNQSKLNSHKLSRWAGSREIYVEDFKITSGVEEKYSFIPYENISLSLLIKTNTPLTQDLNVIVIYAFFTQRGELVAQLKSPNQLFSKDCKELKVNTAVEMRIGPGDYLISISLHKYYNPNEPASTQIYDLIDRSFNFKISDRDLISSTNLLEVTWDFEDKTLSSDKLCLDQI